MWLLILPRVTFTVTLKEKKVYLSQSGTSSDGVDF